VWQFPMQLSSMQFSKRAVVQMLRAGRVVPESQEVVALSLVDCTCCQQQCIGTVIKKPTSYSVLQAVCHTSPLL